MGFRDPYSLALTLAILIISVAVHEACHALTAFRLGDMTPKYQGRLTLNPIAHLDPLGVIMMVIMVFSGYGIGWGKPVQVNPYNLRNGPKTGMAMVSLAGPLSNLTLAAAVAIPLRLHGVQDPLLINILYRIVSINILLAIFNLIPIPPLDGFKVLLGLLSDRQAYSLASLEQYGFGILILLIFAGQFLRFDLLGMIMNPFYSVLQMIILGPTRGFF